MKATNKKAIVTILKNTSSFKCNHIEIIEKDNAVEVAPTNEIGIFTSTELVGYFSMFSTYLKYDYSKEKVILVIS